MPFSQIMPDKWDVIIVGGGPAGLNAALVLGRCQRKVLLVDEGKPRNAKSHTLHGFLSRDGIPPHELLEIARAQLIPYPTVSFLHGRIESATRTDDGFSIQTENGNRFSTRKLLLAGGVVDTLPEQPGFGALYGISVFHCPYCDGWEMRDQPIAVYGRGDDKGAGLALEMTLWNQDIVLCSDGPADLSQDSRDQLAQHGIAIREEKILHLLHGENNIPYQTMFDIVFESGPPLNRAAIFF